MRKMGLNKDYVVGIYNDSSFSTHMTKPEKLKELTEFFTRFKYFGPIVTANSVNEVLDKALGKILYSASYRAYYSRGCFLSTHRKMD